MTQIPLIASAADLPEAIQFAQRRPTSRWFVAARAEALGQAETIPEEWGITASMAVPHISAAEKKVIDEDVADGKEDELPAKIKDPDDDGDDDLVASEDTDHDGAAYRKKLGLAAALLASAIDFEALIAGGYYADYGVEDAFDEFDLDSELPESIVASASQPFTAEQRRKYASQGVALPDGSFPIPNKRYLKKAIRVVGRSSHPASTVRAHIRKRAKALGATSLLPDSYGPVTASTTVTIDGAALAKQVLRDRVNRGKASEPSAITAGRHSLAEDVEHAGHDFEEALHPRGKDGEFISKGGRVVADDGAGHKVEGTVESFHRTLDGGTQVAVKTDQGHTVLTSPSHISEAPKAVASLKPETSAPHTNPTTAVEHLDNAQFHTAQATKHLNGAERTSGAAFEAHTQAATQHQEAAKSHRDQARAMLNQSAAASNEKGKQAIRDRVKSDLTQSHTEGHTPGMTTSTATESADAKAQRTAIEAEQATRSTREQGILDRAGVKNSKVDTSHDTDADLAKYAREKAAKKSNAELKDDLGHEGPSAEGSNAVRDAAREELDRRQGKGAAEGASAEKRDPFTGETRMETLKRTATDLKARGASQSAAHHRREMRVSDQAKSDTKVIEQHLATPTGRKEGLDEIATHNMGSDLTKANVNQLRTYAQFGHKGSKAELARRESAKQALRDRATKGVATPVGPGDTHKAETADEARTRITQATERAKNLKPSDIIKPENHQEAVVEHLKRMGYTDRTAKGARNLTSKDKNTRIKVNDDGTFGMKVNNGNGVYSARNHGVDTSGDAHSVASALHEAGRTAPAVKPHAGKPAGETAIDRARQAAQDRHVRVSNANVAKDEEAARKAAPAGTVPVYNVHTGKVEHVSPDEATAGHVRYGQSLGAGTPAAGQTVKNALDAARKSASERTAADNQTLTERAVQMHGSDRSKWSVANLKSAAAAGDTQAAAALKVKLREKVNPPQVKTAPRSLATQRQANAAKKAENATSFGQGANVGKARGR